MHDLDFSVIEMGGAFRIVVCARQIFENMDFNQTYNYWFTDQVNAFNLRVDFDFIHKNGVDLINAEVVYMILKWEKQQDLSTRFYESLDTYKKTLKLIEIAVLKQALIEQDGAKKSQRLAAMQNQKQKMMIQSIVTGSVHLNQ